MIGIGLSIHQPSATSSGPTPAEETTALLARMSVQPGATRAALINDLIVGLIDDGVWAKLAALYLTAAHDAQAARLNWIANQFNLTAFNAPAFTTDRGYAGDGSSSYLATGFIASASSVFLRDEASIGAWINAGTDAASNANIITGASDGSNGVILVPRGASDTVRGRINTSGASNDHGTSATTLGFGALVRSSSTLTTGYKNGVSTGTNATVSSGRPTVELFIGGYNISGTLSNAMNGRVAAQFMGGALTNGDIGNLYARLNTFLTAIGAN